MRAAYAAHGVQGYYAKEAASYRNPHADALGSALAASFDELFRGAEEQMLLGGPPGAAVAPPEGCNTLRLGDGRGPLALRLLDLACGSGEASLAAYQWLRGDAARSFGRLYLTAADPFTAEAFRSHTGLPQVQGWSFEDVQEGCLEGLAFDVVVCSFAMHLLDESRLYATLRALSVAARWLVLLSPHKRPPVKNKCGWRLVHSGVRERVHVRVYESEGAEGASAVAAEVQE